MATKQSKKPTGSKQQTKAEKPSERQFPLRRLVPNGVTLLALCLGLTAFRQGLNGNFELAVSALCWPVFLTRLTAVWRAC